MLKSVRVFIFFGSEPTKKWNGSLDEISLSPSLGFGPGFGKRQESQPLTVAPARARVAPSPPLAAGRTTGPRLGAASEADHGDGGR